MRNPLAEAHEAIHDRREHGEAHRHDRARDEHPAGQVTHHEAQERLGQGVQAERRSRDRVAPGIIPGAPWMFLTFSTT